MSTTNTNQIEDSKFNILMEKFKELINTARPDPKRRRFCDLEHYEPESKQSQPKPLRADQIPGYNPKDWD